MATNATSGTGLAGLAALSQTNATDTKKKKNDEIGSTDFLQLLVTQLKNQDPLDPSDPQQFAVNLAQFSSLEQLVSINGKIGGSGTSTGDLSSMAGYLGREVTLNSSNIDVKGGDGGTLKLNVPADVSGAKLSLLDSSGKVVKQFNLGDLKQGTQRVNLNGLGIANGTYSFEVSGVSSAGANINVPGAVSGIVTGFRPGANPTLIVNGREIAPSDIGEVNVVEEQSAAPSS